MKDSDSGGSVRGKLADAVPIFALTSNVKTVWSEAMAVTGWDVERYCDRAILDAAPVGITIRDHTRPGTPFVYVNDRFLSMTGYDRADVLGASWSLVSGPATTAEPDTGEARPVERQLYGADGDPFRSRVRVVPLGDDTGHSLCFYEPVDRRDGAVPLLDVTEACWDRLGATAADLSVQTDKRVRADRARLGQLFEDLFRTAVEHGDAWQVTVGELGGQSGFYVEDDGAGDPEPHLTATVDVADAHGWDLAVTEHRTGGTRVELTGVDVVD